MESVSVFSESAFKASLSIESAAAAAANESFFAVLLLLAEHDERLKPIKQNRRKI